MTPAEMREAAAVEALKAARGYAGLVEEDALRDLAAAIRALPLAEDDCQAGGLGLSRDEALKRYGVDVVLAALPHLTGDELRRVAEAMPRVAGEWTTGSHRSGFWRSVGPMRIADVFHPMAGDYWTADVLLGVGWVDLGNHPTARAAQAACDARLEAAGVRLCGERVREEGT